MLFPLLHFQFPAHQMYHIPVLYFPGTQGVCILFRRIPDAFHLGYGRLNVLQSLFFIIHFIPGRTIQDHLPLAAQTFQRTDAAFRVLVNRHIINNRNRIPCKQNLLLRIIKRKGFPGMAGGIDYLQFYPRFQI